MLIPSVSFRELESCLLMLLASDKQPIAETALRATAFLVLHCVKAKQEMPIGLLTSFAKVTTSQMHSHFNHGPPAKNNFLFPSSPQTMNKPSTELKQLLGEVIHFVCAHCELPVPYAKVLSPHLVNGTKEKNTVVSSKLSIKRKNDYFHLLYYI